MPVNVPGTKLYIHKKSKKAKSMNVKKKTKAGAYKKKAVKQAVIRRNPMVETKRRTHGVITALNASQAGVPSANYPDHVGVGTTIPNDDGITVLDLASYYRNSHGFEEWNVIGDTLFSKWLKLKISFQFPSGTDMIVNPVRLYLITGWVTAPSNFTNNTVPTESGATRGDLMAHITEQVKEFFDQKEDFLRFREKTTSAFKQLKWQRIVPNLNQSIAAPPGQGLLADETVRTLGAVPDVNRSFTWKTFRKVHLSQGKETANATDALNPDIQNLYPNNTNWLPVAIIYNPDFAQMRNADDENTQMIIRYNNIHYYSDS